MAAPNVVSIRSEPDVLAARIAARDAARRTGFNAVDQARIATIASELARYILLCAHGGWVTISHIRHDQEPGIELVAEGQALDSAEPSRELIGTAVTPDWENIRLLAHRLMDEMDIVGDNEPELKVICRKWRRPWAI
ncbi:MAG: ATP-binding protein [Chloroflexales bacterium]|nr:ATP-binding protein [Chloroflexales bacterium]